MLLKCPIFPMEGERERDVKGLTMLLLVVSLICKVLLLHCSHR